MLAISDSVFCSVRRDTAICDTTTSKVVLYRSFKLFLTPDQYKDAGDLSPYTHVPRNSDQNFQRNTISLGGDIYTTVIFLKSAKRI